MINAKTTFLYTPESDQAQFFGAKDIDDESIFWVYKIDKRSKSDGLFSFDGTYILFDDLLGRGIIEDRRPQNESAGAVLPSILAGTGWSVGEINTTNLGTSNYYYVSKLEAFWDFLAKWRVEYKPRITFNGSVVTGKYVDIFDKRSQDFGKWYEYGDKLITVTAEESSVPFTAYIGRGKGLETGDGYGRRITFEDIVWAKPSSPVNKPLGQNYIEIPEATAAYGYEDGSPRIGIVEFPDITDPAELIQATYNYANENCRPKVQLTSNVSETETAEVGETVAIIRDGIGIRYKTRIFRYTRDFLNPKIRRIDFGDRLQTSTAGRLKETANQIKKAEAETLSLMQALRAAITSAYFNDDGYNYDLLAGNDYNLPGGYYSFDRPIDQSPTKVIYMGAGKLLIANSKDPDGSWIWRTAMDGDGILADVITAGTLNADLIKSGKLKAQYVEIGSSSTFLEGYDPATKAEASAVYTKSQINTKFEAQDGIIKATVTNEVTDQIATVGIYKVDLISTGGLAFKNGVIFTTIMARVYKNNVDITDQIGAERFRWTKINADGSLDTNWNDAHIGGAKQVTLSSSDVYRRTSLTCDILEG